jgi:hypothetical protein
MMTQLPKNKKPTEGFQARFFGEAQILWKILTCNNLRNEKALKSWKNAKKSVFLMAQNACFAAKTPKKRPFFAVSTFFKARLGPG